MLLEQARGGFVMFTLRREYPAGGSSSWIDGLPLLSAPNTHYSSIHSFSRCISLFLSASLAHSEGTFAITLPLFLLFLPPSIPSGPFSKVLAINHNSDGEASIAFGRASRMACGFGGVRISCPVSRSHLIH